MKTALLQDWTGIKSGEIDDGPNLTPPYYTEQGKLLTTYKEIRRHQDAVVQTYVSHKLYGKYNGLPANEMTGRAMQHEALCMLHEQKAKGNIHPHATIERWLDYTDPKGLWLKWTRPPSEDELWGWSPRGAHCGHWKGKLAPWTGPQTMREYMDLYGGTGRTPFHIHTPTAHRLIRDRIRARLAPDILNHNGVAPRALGVSFRDAKQNELIALGLLKQMVPADVFRKYLTYGFVTINGASGLAYKINRGSHLIDVLSMGQQVAKLCVYVPGIPPTDDVVAKILIIEADEQEIWTRANKRFGAEYQPGRMLA